ncbi:hypothetical protein [Desulforamulus ruminis]|nr:hypothetical protein [Desulforamulus ruminis]
MEAHDPTPVPEPPSEIEVIGQQLVDLELRMLELQEQRSKSLLNRLLG